MGLKLQKLLIKILHGDPPKKLVICYVSYSGTSIGIKLDLIVEKNQLISKSLLRTVKLI
jgi:hypothetical protein